MADSHKFKNVKVVDESAEMVKYYSRISDFTSDVFKDLCSRPRPRNTQGQHQGHSEAASTATHDNEKYSVFDM